MYKRQQNYISGDRVELLFDLPLGEIVIDFYDKLKSVSRGYASFDYHMLDFRPSKLVKLDILINGEPVDALSLLTHFDNAQSLGRRMCEKLKELIPRQQFDIAIPVSYTHLDVYKRQGFQLIPENVGGAAGPCHFYPCNNRKT